MTNDSDNLILPVGTAFQWTGGEFLATHSELESGSQAITDMLAAQGMAAAMAVSGGGTFVPWPAGATANVRLTAPMTLTQARERLEAAFGNTFTFLTAVTASIETVGAAADYVAATTANQVASGVDNAAKAAFPLATVAVVGILGVGAIVAMLKFA